MDSGSALIDFGRSLPVLTFGIVGDSRLTADIRRISSRMRSMGLCPSAGFFEAPLACPFELPLECPFVVMRQSPRATATATGCTSRSGHDRVIRLLDAVPAFIAVHRV